MDAFLEPQAIRAFSEDARRAVYDAIRLRRDVRHFEPNLDVSDDVLERILGAAHLAPSVGFSQPWGFVVVRDKAKRARIRESFLACRRAEAARFPPERREPYLALRLEAILEAPLNVCVAVDLRADGEAILGTTAQPEAVRASACCAVQNLWLAARTEGIGVGWVSIVEPAVLRTELSLPPGVEPIAYLCVGHPVAFRDRPMLEETDWRSRKPLKTAIHPGGNWNGDGAPRESNRVAPPERLETSIRPPSETARSAAFAHQTTLTKPAGSLGRLEELAAFYAAARGAFPPPALRKAALTLFAADHGVVVEGVSAYGSEITAAMVCNVMSGGAAVNALAKDFDVDIALVDVGVAGDLSAAPLRPVVPLRSRRIRSGTDNLRRGPALERRDVEAAVEVGRSVARDVMDGGADAIGLGEIGIGNTTSAAALTAWFTGVPPSDVVGRGTGIDDDARARKIDVVTEAILRCRSEANDAIDALAHLGGLEVAAMTGAALEAASRGVPIVLDGFVTTAAALAAVAIDAAASQYFVASHVSAERGARIALERLGLRPILDLDMRLGEGTGAVIALGLLRAAVNTQRSMATFATAGVVGRPGTDLPEPR
jgi:nicotinate-nucleotide--dimethylbenzimidazole phosphoribosyltransferase